MFARLFFFGGVIYIYSFSNKQALTQERTKTSMQPHQDHQDQQNRNKKQGKAQHPGAEKTTASSLDLWNMT
jgi:cbb3-type cytochrome oxidase subunit 3